MFCELFGCECGKYIAPNKCEMCLVAKRNLKRSDSELEFDMVNVNVDVREGLSSILTKVDEG